MAVINGASEQMDSLGSAVPFANLPGRANRAKVSVTGAQPVRWREDAGSPTSSVGHVAIQYTHFYVTGRSQLEGFRIIETSASSSIFVTYYDNVNDV